jgi:hypothetical protein
MQSGPYLSDRIRSASRQPGRVGMMMRTRATESANEAFVTISGCHAPLLSDGEVLLLTERDQLSVLSQNLAVDYTHHSVAIYLGVE